MIKQAKQVGINIREQSHHNLLITPKSFNHNTYKIKEELHTIRLLNLPLQYLLANITKSTLITTIYIQITYKKRVKNKVYLPLNAL